MAGGVAATTVLVGTTSAVAVVDPGGCAAAAGLRDRPEPRRDRLLPSAPRPLSRGANSLARAAPDPFSTFGVDRVVATSATSTVSTTAREPWGELVGTIAAAAPTATGAPVAG